MLRHIVCRPHDHLIAFVEIELAMIGGVAELVNNARHFIAGKQRRVFDASHDTRLLRVLHIAIR